MYANFLLQPTFVVSSLIKCITDWAYTYRIMIFTFEVMAHTYLPCVTHPAYSGVIQTQYNGEKRVPIFEIFTAVKILI